MLPRLLVDARSKLLMGVRRFLDRLIPRTRGDEVCNRDEVFCTRSSEEGVEGIEGETEEEWLVGRSRSEFDEVIELVPLLKRELKWRVGRPCLNLAEFVQDCEVPARFE